MDPAQIMLYLQLIEQGAAVLGSIVDIGKRIAAAHQAGTTITDADWNALEAKFQSDVAAAQQAVADAKAAAAPAPAPAA